MKRRRTELTTPTSSYNGTAKFLHWLIFGLLAGQFLIAWSMPHIGRNTPPSTLIDLHFSVGVVVMIVAVIRLGWRLLHKPPSSLADLPWWQNAAAHLVHWLLYALLILLPILGWMNASWRGMPVALFGLELPQLVTTRAPGWAWSGDVHVVLSNYALLALVGLHVVAALYHQFIRRDGVLQRMLPNIQRDSF
jgi:cytochrome b561